MIHRSLGVGLLLLATPAALLAQDAGGAAPMRPYVHVPSWPTRSCGS